MRIGIDASRALSRTPTGTETYSRELIRALLTLDPANEYVLYTREPVEFGFWGRVHGVQTKAIVFPRLWTLVRLSIEMLAKPPDLLFVPAHVLPPIHPRRSIVTIHDFGHLHFPEAHPRLQRAYHTWSTRWNARSAWRVFADSEATEQDIVKFCGIPPEKIAVIYPGFDSHLFKPVRDRARLEETRRRYGIEGDYVLSVGTLHPRKNYVRLLQAFAQTVPQVQQLLIVGKRGWLYEDIFAEVKRLELESRVQFLDYVAAAEMPALLSGARMLAFPSLHEGFGLPVLEAQACETPVVCSITSSLPEAAGDGALLVDPCDVDALAAAMQRILKDDAIRRKIVANGLRNIKRFSWENSARQVLQVMTESSP